MMPLNWALFGTIYEVTVNHLCTLIHLPSKNHSLINQLTTHLICKPALQSQR